MERAIAAVKSCPPAPGRAKLTPPMTNGISSAADAGAHALTTRPRAPLLLVSLALVGFAANSLLCREALRPPSTIDAVTFATVRLLSGAITLLLIARFSGGGRSARGNWFSAAALFAYAIAFSVAYVRMTVGTGALLLFAAVQLTMVAAALRAGERLTWLQWLGFVLAIAGLIILSWRGISAPDPLAAALMAIAGVAWGIYSLRGRGSTQPLVDTAGNFARAVPLALLATILAFRSEHFSATGLFLAIASGALASGIGYSIWYAALPQITATSASIVQLAVPVLAAAGGIVLLGERPTVRLLLAAVTILAGVALAVLSHRRRAESRSRAS
jgi:drug/metabolite transporter (DMT)-like permease